METHAEEPAAEPHLNGSGAEDPSPAREMSLHLLRMVETRLEAAGIVLQNEGNRLATRLQLQVAGGAAIFVAIWGGIVLLAIALPPNLRVPVLSGVVAAFVAVAAWAFIKANRMIAGRDVGSLHWFVESLKRDVEVLSRTLTESQHAPRAPHTDPPGSPRDHAA
jgi:uncharacterized membrane protein YqjE